MFALLALVSCSRAFAWEQLYLSGELTITLGERQPFGFAASGAFGEAPIDNGLGPDLRIGGEVAFAPGGIALTPFGRVGVIGANYGYTNWNYSPIGMTYTEFGYTFRPFSWSGVRVGGGFGIEFVTVRYHQVIPVHALAPAAPINQPAAHDPHLPLPLPDRHPASMPHLDIQLAIAFEPWIYPSFLGNTYDCCYY